MSIHLGYRLISQENATGFVQLQTIDATNSTRTLRFRLVDEVGSVAPTQDLLFPFPPFFFFSSGQQTIQQSSDLPSERGQIFPTDLPIYLLSYYLTNKLSLEISTLIGEK